MISKSQLIYLFAFMLLLAVVPRIYQLGTSGFYGDEEITSLAAHSYALEGKSAMPSGMPYNRALPHILANASMAKIFGEKREISYRIISSVLGIATVLLIFFMAKQFIGIEVAFIAAFLLALSEWHISNSREARMYAPFLFFYLASAYSFIRWHENNKKIALLFAWLICSFTSVALHKLGMLFALFPMFFLLTEKTLKPLQQIIYFAISISFVCSATLYHKIFISKQFTLWANTHGQAVHNADFSRQYFLEIINHISNNHWLLVFTIMAIIIAVIFSIKINNSDQQYLSFSQKLAMFGAWIIIFIASFTGNLYAAALTFLAILLIHSEKYFDYIFKCKLPIVIIAFVSATWFLWLINQHGLVTAIKQTTSFPYPYFSYYAQLSLGLLIFFVVGIALEFFNVDRQKYVRVFILATIVPIGIIGLMERWGALRYIITTYPFLILIASYGMFNVFRYLTSRITPYKIELIPTTLALTIVCIGALGLSGLPQAWRAANKSYGDPITQLKNGAQLYPDHKTPGEYVRDNLLTHDIVVAEDALQQFWYIGKVDYWLRNAKTHGHFTYLASTDDQIRDLYINSLVVDDDIVDTLSDNNKDRIWLITSAETQTNKEFYLSNKQLAWVNKIEQDNAPTYLGLDGISKVFCINCNE